MCCIILFWAGSPILRVSANGGPVTPATQIDSRKGEASHRFPQFLPDGKHFLFYVYGQDQSHNTVEFATLGSFNRRTVLEGASAAIYARGPGGDAYLLYQRDQTLLAQRFDESAGALLGEPAALADNVAAVGASNRLPAISASWNGTLAYRSSSSGTSTQLTWFDLAGKITGRAGEPLGYGDVALSPDGARVVFSRSDTQGRANLWLLELRRDVLSRFTTDLATDRYPVWSPDGDRIAFASNRNGGRLNMYWKPSNGDKEELLFASDEEKVPTSWSRDGRFLIYHALSPKTGSDLWMLPLDGDRKPWRVLATEFNESWGCFSPDGQWIVYQSDESGSPQIYVRRFMPPGTGSASTEAGIPLSKDGGQLPRWRDDGKEIVFVIPSPVGLQIMAVEVSSSPTFRAGVARPLFQATAAPNSALFTGPGDFKRFLIPARPQQNASQPEPITLMLNWPAALKR